MREIKFRAWDASEKEMVYAPQHDPDDWFIGLIDGEAPEGDLLMQYTGLKDKNGKEIYEGDIVNMFSGGHLGKQMKDFHSITREWSTQVYFDNGSFLITVPILNEKTGEMLYTSKEPIGKWNCSYCVEVIGNIYENPHRLK